MTVAVFSVAECIEHTEKKQRWCWDTTVCMQAVINKSEKNLSDCESSAHFIIWKKVNEKETVNKSWNNLPNYFSNCIIVIWPLFMLT